MDRDVVRVMLELPHDVAERLANVAACLEGDREGLICRTLIAGLPAIEALAARHVAHCPRCGPTTYEVRESDTVRLQQCRKCEGVFLDNPSATAFVRTPDFALIEGLSTDRAPDTADARPCPLCQLPMDHRVFEHLEVRIDLCGQHGTWFDRGELPALTPWLHRVATTARLDGPGYQEAQIVSDAMSAREPVVG